MHKQTTPEKITGRIRAFLRLAELREPPIYLPFTHVDDSYQATYCLDNCAHAARLGLGTIAYGWIIWDSSSMRFTEAEFHAVLMKNSELLDITPRKDGEELVLFVPDMSRTPHFAGAGWSTFTNIISRDGVIENSVGSIRGFAPSLH